MTDEHDCLHTQVQENSNDVKRLCLTRPRNPLAALRRTHGTQPSAYAYSRVNKKAPVARRVDPDELFETVHRLELQIVKGQRLYVLQVRGSEPDRRGIQTWTATSLALWSRAGRYERLIPHPMRGERRGLSGLFHLVDEFIAEVNPNANVEVGHE